jgi:hypothetical protein
VGRTTKRTWLFALALVAILATTAACGDDDDGGGGDGEQAQQSTTTESTTTTIAAEGPAEWVEVAQDLENREAQLLADPDPDRVRELYAEECPCYPDLLAEIQTFVDNGTHVEGEPYRVVWVRHENTAQDGAVRLSVKIVTTRISIVDENGQVLDESTDDEVGVERCVSTLVRQDGANASYRIHDSSQLQGCPTGS